MTTMVMNYCGPATLRTDTATVEVDVTLVTDDGGNVRTWGGQAASLDLDALRLLAHRTSGTLVLPDGREAEVYVASSHIDSAQPGVQLRLHGSGPAPY